MSDLEDRYDLDNVHFFWEVVEDNGMFRVNVKANSEQMHSSLEYQTKEEAESYAMGYMFGYKTGLK